MPEDSDDFDACCNTPSLRTKMNEGLVYWRLKIWHKIMDKREFHSLIFRFFNDFSAMGQFLCCFACCVFMDGLLFVFNEFGIEAICLRFHF